MNETLLSIIIPVFNADRYLARCLDSVVNQDMRNYEIIIINDGSSDESEMIIESYKNNHNNIRYIPLALNSGAGNARNNGIDIANGKYIGFVDCDDWIDVDMFSKMLSCIESTTADIALCGVRHEWNNYSSSFTKYKYDKQHLLTGKYCLRLLCQEARNNYMISPVIWNKIYRKEFLENNALLFQSNSYWDDDLFSFIAFVYANGVITVPDVYYHYFQRPNSITKSFSKKHIDDLVTTFQLLKKTLVESGIYSEYVQHYRSYFERCICSLFNILMQSESKIDVQKKYITYLFEQFIEHFSVSDTVDYFDIERIQRFFSKARE